MTLRFLKVSNIVKVDRKCCPSLIDLLKGYRSPGYIHGQQHDGNSHLGHSLVDPVLLFSLNGFYAYHESVVSLLKPAYGSCTCYYTYIM